MAIRCVMCKNNPFRKKVSFHSFPKNPVIRAKWLKFCGLEENEIFLSSCKVCSDHFLVEDFVAHRTDGLHRFLKKGSVPSVKKKPKSRKLLTLRPALPTLRPALPTPRPALPTFLLSIVSYQPQCETTIISVQPSSDGYVNGNATTSSHCINSESLQGSAPSLLMDENVMTNGHYVNSANLQESAPFSSIDEYMVGNVVTIGHCRNSESLEGSAPSSTIELISDSENIMETPRVHESVQNQSSIYGAAIDQTFRKSRLDVPSYVGDICFSNMQTAEQAEVAFNVAKTAVEKQRKTIVSLQQKFKRLFNKTENLQDLVRQLRKKNLITEEAANSILAI